jgi:hypothetical protein
MLDIWWYMSIWAYHLCSNPPETDCWFEIDWRLSHYWCYIILCPTVSCYITLYHTISHFTNLYHTLSHYITLHISHSDTAPLFRDITSRWMVHYLYCQCVEWWFQMITSNDLVMCWMGWNQQSDMKDHCTHTCIYIYIHVCVVHVN